MRGHELNEGAACAVCGIEHPKMLRRHSFADVPAVLCANHKALAGRRPLTLAEFMAELRPLTVIERRGLAERRRQVERREGAERRDFAEPVDLDSRRANRRAS